MCNAMVAEPGAALACLPASPLLCSQAHSLPLLSPRLSPFPANQAADRRAAVLAVDGAARELWPHSRVAVFGSQATGLALPGSDLDIVVSEVGGCV